MKTIEQANAQRRYSVQEIDQMRRDILTTLGHDDSGCNMRWSFDADGNRKGGSGGGESWGSGEKSPDEKRQERAEDLLRTHLINGTDPEQLRQEAEDYRLRRSIDEARSVVFQRRYKMLPEPADCHSVLLLKEHGAYPPDERDQAEVAEMAAKARQKADQDKAAIERLRNCGHLRGAHFLKTTDQCGYCEHGLMPGLIVHNDREGAYRCNNCNSMTKEPMVYLPDWVQRGDSPEDIMENKRNSSHGSGWCLSCAKARVSSPEHRSIIKSVAITATRDPVSLFPFIIVGAAIIFATILVALSP